MAQDRIDFLDLCRAVEESSHTDLSYADRELLIVLHKALSSLKLSVERALVNTTTEGYASN
jgi:IS5 family transposase